MTEVLYHASTNKELTVLTPQRTLSKDEYIGDFVFATPDRRMAAMYLAPREGGTILIETFSREPYAVINNTPENFKRVDHGGAIYKVSAESFSDTPQEEVAGTELVSRDSVPILSKEIFATSLEAMREAGVNVYFLGDTEFQRVQSAKDHGWEILSELKPYDFK